jgi:hypothetical protein
MAGESRIDILIAARDEAAATLKNVNKELKELGEGGQEAAGGIDELFGSLKAIAGLAAVQQVGKFALQADAAATAYKRQSLAAVSLAGSQGELNALMGAYDKATGGAVDKATALSDVTRLQALGFADSAKELASFTTAARGISVALGSQQDYVISQLQLAIANQSTMRLDQLGLGVAEVQARITKLKAADSGLTTEMAFQNAVLGLATEKYGKLATSTEAQATGAEKAAKAWKNFSLEFGLALGPVTGGVMQGLADQIKAISDRLQDVARDAAKAKTALDGMGGGSGGGSGGTFSAIMNFDPVKFAKDAIANQFSDEGQAKGQIAGLQNMIAGLEAGKARLEASKGTEFFDAAALDRQIGLLATAKAQLADLQHQLDQMAPAANNASIATNAAGNSTQWMSEAAERARIHLDATGDAAAKYGAAVKAAGGATDSMTGSVLTLAGALPGLQARLNTFLAGAAAARDSAVSALASQAAGTDIGQADRLTLYAEGVAKIDAQTAALNKDLRDHVITQDAYTLAIAQLGSGAGDAFDAITQAQQEAESSAKRLASTVDNDLKKAYEHVASAVSGVLQGALGDVAGVNPNDLLVDPKEKDPKKQVKLLDRPDAINEDARRLADVAVRGFDSPWAEYFKTKFPALWAQNFAGAGNSLDLRRQAATLIANFQDGLEPELLDKEKAKERVRRMLIGEQKMADLAKEITAELNAELGNTAPADLAGKVSQALTGGGGGANALAGASGQGASAAGTAGGTAAGAAFSNAAAQAGAGAGDKLIAALDASLKADANVTLIKTAGQGAGNNWGGAFLSTVGNNVPKALIDLLTNLVTPGVLAYFNTQSQLTGANP